MSHTHTKGNNKGTYSASGDNECSPLTKIQSSTRGVVPWFISTIQTTVFLHGLDPFKDKPYSFQKLISLCIYLGSVHFVSIVCRAVSNNMHYLHWICEPGTLLCFSVLDTDAFRGVFGDLFSQRVLCTTSICVAETQPTSFWLSHLGLSAALKNESPCLVLSLHNDWA